MRACNYAISGVRDWLFFKLKPRFTHKRAGNLCNPRCEGLVIFEIETAFYAQAVGNYEIYAMRDWLFL